MAKEKHQKIDIEALQKAADIYNKYCSKCQEIRETIGPDRCNLCRHGKELMVLYKKGKL